MVQLQQHDSQARNVNTAPFAGTNTPYVKIPASDICWASSQRPSVVQLFLDAWASDPYGSRYVKLKHNLRPTAFRLARKLLTEQGLFMFKRDVSVIDSRATNCWLTLNLHGARCTWVDDTALVPELTATALESVTPAPPILARAYIEPALPEASLSLQNPSNQQQNSVEEIVVGLEAEESKTHCEFQPTREETRVVLTKLREMGMRLNPTLQTLVLKFYSRVPSAVAHIKERIASGERFKNLEGAFVQAVKHSAQPQRSRPTWGYHAEINPPSPEQLAALDAAKASGLIRDYYLSSDNICKVVHERLGIIPWFEYMELGTS